MELKLTTARGLYFLLLIAILLVEVVVGVGVAIVGANEPAVVDPMLGTLVALLGVVVAVSGIAGWASQGFVAHYEETRAGGTDVGTEGKYLWGTLLYFLVELALIGAGTLYFTLVYYAAWPPGGLPPIFVPVIWGISILLLISSFTNYFASTALKNGNERRFLVLFGVTPLIGVALLAGKARNWHRLTVREGYWIDDGVYWSAFFGLDGLHALLVGVGIVFMGVALCRSAGAC